MNLTPNERALFDSFRLAALSGERAPTMDNLQKRGIGDVQRLSTALTAKGAISIEVYGQNWRVIEITTGDYAGKRTEERPKGGFPYIRFDTDGRHELEYGEPIKE